MFRFFEHRLGHYLLLIVCTSLLTLPNLGSFSLFDFDEGVNAEAAREMLEADNWLVPMFNFELRTAKPIMLYWLQMTSYSIFGVSEFSARLPSVLMSILSVLVTYEIGRNMFRASTGLLAGLILSSAIFFNVLAHAATPDATLLIFTVLTFLAIWKGSVSEHRGWYLLAGLATGLATLTKGPVGVGIPGLALLLYFAWNRELGKLLRNRGVIYALIVFGLVTLPWYILVTVETRGAWPKGFFGFHNFQRFTNPLENHRGPIFYHVIGLIVFFAPWSIFLAVTLWNNWKESRSPLAATEMGTHVEKHRRASRLLICWFISYLTFFSIAATKLPNYVLPLYPALAMMTARFLDLWRRERMIFPRWVMPTASFGMLLVGIIASVALVIVGGVIPIQGVKMRYFPGLENVAYLGLIPIITAGVAYSLLRKQRREAVIATFTIGSLLFVGSMAAIATPIFDRYKAPKPLAENGELVRPDEEIRVGSLFYFQPSLVFYAQREVKKFESLEQVNDFLQLPHRVYLFVPEPIWNEVQSRIVTPTTVCAKQYDFLKNYQVLLISNR